MGMKLPPSVIADIEKAEAEGRVSEGPKKPTPIATPKYRNRKTVVDGIEFDSKREANRWTVLRLMEKAGAITYLTRQIEWVIEVNGLRICKYIADFVYYDVNKIRVVEDAKGYKTRDYRIKKKLMKAVHNIEIREV